ncbi:hypothetical protein D9599_11430 [Roseomonas sp. KE2513]|uniref:hypothetical protein n=1 Tax=Roseomonas sp. KE2513 TaxID=2479202 RepID=UPI0018E01F00|nr:hypothetical protein [Roseomonas sp. KE2513]MBI0536186.1 hypothetical protein [Roseomonas sp. KE2513]
MRVPLPGRDYFPPRVLLSRARSALGTLRGLETAGVTVERRDETAPMNSPALVAPTVAPPAGIRAALS